VHSTSSSQHFAEKDIEQRDGGSTLQERQRVRRVLHYVCSNLESELRIHVATQRWISAHSRVITIANQWLCVSWL